jgi:hypothetical protein
MRCNRTLFELKAYTDGELAAPVRWRVRRHLAHCPDCAAQYVDLQRVHTLLLTADVVPQPIPAAPTHFALPPIQKGSTHMMLRLLWGAAVTAGLALALLALPISHHNRSMAAEVRRALEEVNTWHLRGWKLQNGKPIPWEVWGRRTPFFYREQVGQDVVVDNGKQRVSLFAPLKSPGNRNATPGILLKTPSMPQSENVRWSYERISLLWRGDVKPWAQTDEGPIFKFEESGVFYGGEFDSGTDLLFTVDRNTWLPIRYEARLGKGDRNHTIATLTADYNTAIPVDLARLPASVPGYQVYDTTQSVSAPPHDNAVTQQGITVQATPLLLDTQGNILLRVKVWMGNLLVDRSCPIGLNVSVDRWTDPDSRAIRTPATTDDQRRPYVEVDWPDTQNGNPDSSSRLLLLAPAEPMDPDAAPPTALSLRMTVAVQMNSRLSGTLGLGDSQLSEHRFQLTVPLPEPSSPSMERSAYAYLDPNWRQHSISPDGFENLQAATDGARATFYGFYMDMRHPDRERLQQTAKWYDQFLLHSSCRAAKRFFKPHIAQIYNLLGNKVRARQLLKEAVEDTYNPYIQAARPGMTPVQRKQMDAANRENRQIEARNHNNAVEALRRFDDDH